VLETPHVIVGAAIATKIANPILSLPLVLGSHFILDKVPHWNPHLNTEKNKYGKVTKGSRKIIVMDIASSIFFGSFIALRAIPDYRKVTLIFLACFLSILPDVIEGPYFFLDWNKKWIKKWIRFQKSIQTDIDIVPGLVIQFITVLAAFWWIFV